MRNKVHELHFVVAVVLSDMAWVCLIGCYLWSNTTITGQDVAAPTVLAASSTTGPDRSLNQELVGLRGELTTVAFVVDRSGSMNRHGRWANARAIIRTWLEHLPIQRAVLIIFNDDITVFPAGGYMEVTGTDARRNRDALLAAFDNITPQGNTNTLKALRRAYDYTDAGAIFLFSDGAPDSGMNRFDHRMAAQVIALCHQHGNQRPVNTIGLGDYLNDRSMGQFLATIAAETGGTFLGR